MQQQLDFDRRRTFQRAFQALLMSQMLVGYLTARPCHHIRLSREKGPVKGWDDVVVVRADGVFVHHQVKYQETAFDTRPAMRGQKKRGSSGDQEPTPLDTDFAGLAAWLKIQSNVPVRRFVLVVPHRSLSIKKDLEVRHVAELCDECRKDGVSSEVLASSHDRQRVVEWLSTWCGFETPDLVFAALSALEVMCVNALRDMRDASTKVLSHCYEDPDATHSQIERILDEQASAVGATTPRLMAGRLSGRLANVVGWTQYHEEHPGEWSISGTHAVTTVEVEPAASVVGAMWRADGGGSLRVASAWRTPTGDLQVALARLALHVGSPARIFFSERDRWEMGTNQLAGGTLGQEQTVPQHWQQAATLASVDLRPLASIEEELREAKELSETMNSRCWELVRGDVRRFIIETEGGEIRSALERRWKEWRDRLDRDETARHDLLRGLVHAKAERKDVLADLRLGHARRGS
jgi:hypothetical protein